ncbi:MAG: Eco57I restriction-modification methylase domain-containing protein [Bacteroidales bacterium]|jgi:adenine-specific DNA-methyltransferase|nr:Eco57I restriction-modification methylase domain-containing protein [Bacteroidales bacterium]
MKLNYFRDTSFLQAIKTLFNELNVPVNYVSDEPTTAKEILKDTYKDNGAFLLVNEVYFVGMVDDAAFKDSKSIDVEKIKSDYDGILIFGITLNQRENKLLPTRSQLAEISRAFNREFYYTPVILVFKYADDKGQYIAFANTERMQYKQAWREGEKAGKVSLLRDIDIQCPHRGHEDIIKQLRIQTTGKNPIDSFSKLYAYWQEVFSVNILNKRFYQDLSNWYFWAVKQVTFPGEPSKFDALKKNTKLDDLIQEHNATNVIRLLTRLLFTWFIKEKKLIPEELFDLETLQKEILIDIAPYHEDGLFSHANKDSVYYKAILQNLFFASLNCPIKPDEADSRERGFRGDSYGTHRGIDYLMRHKRYFKNPNAFLELMNKTVPFLNGGLFECLDDKYNNTYIDGFSDQMTKGERLIVPDYLFFGTSEKVDLSTEYGINNKTTKSAAVKGLINILKSYKFTITENTPIEEDVALDPELLGKVFENLLASYNPETKTTARKQTGSFYTPREIVNYMVDESIIAYLKNAVTDWEMDEKQVDEKLRHLASFDSKNPFAENEKLINDIVSALDRCKILDPACGSGAFPMGVLQKMVHILQKLDPDNSIWKEVQTQKAQEETSKVFKSIDDRAEREEKLKEINNAFDQRVNDPDYARKLYLIENCIYGVDIQPIATQIAKLRFFISLVVDQKSNSNADENFGIHPLPNLETKFVTANTLIGIDKPNVQYSLYDIKEVKELESELKKVRHKLFNARTKDTKLKYRQRDEELRNAIASELEKSGWKSYNAEKLAKWDPYDQHASSSFFDSEWMFDIADGFDIVIGNPPYVQLQKSGGTLAKQYEKVKYKTFERTGDIYSLFYEKGIELLKPKGILCFITSNKWMRAGYGESTRKFFVENINPLILIDFAGQKIFDSATVDTNILLLSKEKNHHKTLACVVKENVLNNLSVFVNQVGTECNFTTKDSWTILSPIEQSIKKKIEKVGTPLKDWNINIYRGILTGYNKAFIIDGITKDKLINEDAKSAEIIRPILRGRDIKRYGYNFSDLWLINSHNGIKEKGIKPININDYPAVKQHLDKYFPQLENRQDKGDTPYNLRNCAYMEDFNRQKIMYSEIVKEPQFYLDNAGEFFPEATTFILTGNHLEYLCNMFNSKTIAYAFKTFYAGGGLGESGYRYKKVFFEKLPIPKFDNNKIQQQIKNAQITNNIESLIFKLYGFNSYEISEIEQI